MAAFGNHETVSVAFYLGTLAHWDRRVNNNININGSKLLQWRFEFVVIITGDKNKSKSYLLFFWRICICVTSTQS